MISKTLTAFIAFAASASASCLHGTSLLPRQEGQVTVSDFSYTGLTGPLNWAGIKPENVACRTAKVQSPIVLDQNIPFTTEIPQISIAPVAAAELVNLGTTIETVVTGTTVFANTTFTLQQFHLHTPSEHRINEEYFPLEMHMVHESAAKDIAVIAVLFQLSEDGSTTDILTGVAQNLAQVQTPGTQTTTGPLDFTSLIAAIQGQQLFQYTGSLTTPPCKEGLTFLVTSQPLPVDVKTFNALKSTIKFNSRYSQNTLGQTNLLDVAAQLAIREAGVIPPTAGGGVGATNGTQIDANGNVVTSTDNSQVDVTALVQELVKSQGQNALQFETVTKSVTTVRLQNGAGAGQVGGQAGEINANAQVPPPSAATVHSGAQPTVVLVSPPKKQHQQSQPQVHSPPQAQPQAQVQTHSQPNGENTRIVKIQRSRIGRSLVGKRRLN